jgi:hypothetical protein
MGFGVVLEKSSSSSMGFMSRALQGRGRSSFVIRSLSFATIA